LVGTCFVFQPMCSYLGCFNNVLMVCKPILDVEGKDRLGFHICMRQSKLLGLKILT